MYKIQPTGQFMDDLREIDGGTDRLEEALEKHLYPYLTYNPWIGARSSRVEGVFIARKWVIWQVLLVRVYYTVDVEHRLVVPFAAEAEDLRVM